MMDSFIIYPASIQYLLGAFTNPLGIVYDVAGNRIAVLEVGLRITFLNATTYAVVHTLNLPTSGNAIGGLGFDSVSNRFFVGEDSGSGAPNGRIRVFSGVDYSEITNFYHSSYAQYRGFAFDYSTDRMFVSCAGLATLQPISTVEVYKISDLSFVTSFNTDKSVGIEIDSVARKLYVAGGVSANIRTYDLDTYAQIDVITGTGVFVLSNVYGITQDPNNSDYMIAQDIALNKILLLQKSTNALIKVMNGVTSPRMSVFVGTKIMVTQANINKVSEYLLFY